MTTGDHAREPLFTSGSGDVSVSLGPDAMRSVIELCGGQMEIAGNAGRGRVISIRLPTIEMTGDAERPADSPRTSENGKIVLLVEDDPDVRIVLAAQLGSLGYKVHVVANGVEAIDVIESPARLDVALADMVLPGSIDGISLVKAAMRARPAMAVVCMSGYDLAPFHRHWFKVQNIELLEKPFSIHQLSKALDKTLVR